MFVRSEATLCLICGNYFCCKMEYYYRKSRKCSRHVDKGGVSSLRTPQVEIFIHRTLVEP
jgi:hypothetical protein